ncbi:MAG: methyltransferase [Pararhizobium sp.]
MIQTFLSSGELIADRRADYARGLAEARAFADAAEVMAQALELAPSWAAGWFRLGTYLEAAGQAEAASEAYRTVLRLTDRDIFGAGLKIAMLGQAGEPRVAPAAFVERLFDDYAGRFDTSLLQKLGYSVPERLAALIGEARPDAGFAHAVDLGCGTGLMGERLRARVSYLEGYDLSRGMLERARAKQIYDHLDRIDLSLAPDPSRLPLSGAAPADLVTAADVMIYLGALDSVFATAAMILAGGGLFAFSVERNAEAGEWRLQPTLRYAHGEAYIRRIAESHGFAVHTLVPAPIRSEGPETIAGLLAVAERQTPPKEASVDAGAVDEAVADPRPRLH